MYQTKSTVRFTQRMKMETLVRKLEYTRKENPHFIKNNNSKFI